MAMHVSNFDLLVKWEFQLFEQLSLYRDEKDFATTLNSLISPKQFQLISKLMSKASKFTDQEIIELFHLGDKFLISGQAKEKLFSLFILHFSLGHEENAHDLECLNLWNDFVNYLKRNRAVVMDKNTIKLDGLKVNPESKGESFALLKNLAKNYKVLYIRDIPLCSNDLKAIHSDLTELHIERCPFNFEEQFDLSQLAHLTHFTCSRCYADRHLLFTLESLKCDLEYLDISDNWVNPIDHSPLADWIETQKSLKHLNLSGNNLSPKSAPTIYNVFFNLPSLEVLNLAGNYLGFEFSKQLSSFSGTLNWKSFTINDFDIFLWNSDLYSICFSKLKQLEYLNMSNNNTEQYFSPSLCKGLSELTNLKDFLFNSHTGREYPIEVESLFKNNPNLKLECFPNMHDFEMSTSCDLSNNHPIGALPKGLRILDICTKEKIKNLDFLNDLSNFTLLTKLEIQIKFEMVSNSNLTETIYLPNLNELLIHQQVFDSATFVLPELRKLTIENLNNSSLDYLKEYKKLKNIKLTHIEKGITQKIIDSNLFSSFSGLNVFSSDECRCFTGKSSYDFVSDEISNSLVHLTLHHDNSSIDYYCEDEIAKQLQEKKIPYLYRYDDNILVC